MALKTFDVLIPDHYFCDIIFTDIPAFPALGTELFSGGVNVIPGGVMNTLIALQRLGIRAGWLGTLGNDFFSSYVKTIAEKEGVDLSLIDFIDTSFKRVTVALSYTADRAFVTYQDPDIDLIAPLFELMNDPPFKHLHFAGLMLDERLPSLIDKCHREGIQVSMDCQHKDTTLDDALCHEIMSKIDIFMPNATEAMRLTQTESLYEASNRLRNLVPLVIVKDGSNGSYSWHDGKAIHIPASTIENVIDTTGAGDVFNAGFLSAYLQKLPLETCLRYGNIAGALSLRGHGGYTTAPTIAELKDYLRSYS